MSWVSLPLSFARNAIKITTTDLRKPHIFVMQCVATLLLFASGLVLWLPEAMSQTLRLAAIVTHSATAVLSIFGIIVHIYMGTAAVPGAFRGMIRGWVPSGWARAHHPKWHRKITKR